MKCDKWFHMYSDEKGLKLICDEVADVRENVRGEWLDSRANLYDKKHVYKQCSNCGTGFIYGVVMPKRPDGKIPVHTQFHNYCPNCGAQMIRGES